MADWVAAVEPGEVLDPAAGAGALLAPLAGISRLVACEREPDLREVLRRRLPGARVEEDFWQLGEGRYPAIIANPPYLGHGQVSDKHRIHEQLKAAGIPPVPLTTNLAVLFYLGCWARLAPGGRMVFLMPTEFMQTRGGVAVKRFLVEQGALSAVVDLDDDGLFGPGVISTACLVLAERRESARIIFARHTGRPPYPAWPDMLGTGRALTREEVDPTRRWRPERSQRAAGDTQPLSALVEIRPGVITGRNAFFLISRPEAVRRGLEDSVRYCLIRPHQLEGEWFHDQAEISRLASTQERRWLVDIGDVPSPSERAYLDEGEVTGVHETPTACSRTPWWRQEPGPGCDLAVGNFRRTDYRVTAHTRAGELCPMDFAVVPNRLTMRPGHRDLVAVMTAYLISAAGQAALRGQERHAGSGLYTLRSGALKDVTVPHLELTSAGWRAEVEAALRELIAADLRSDGPGRAAARAAIDGLCARPRLAEGAVAA